MTWELGLTALLALMGVVTGVYSIWRNGRNQRDKFTTVQNELKFTREDSKEIKEKMEKVETNVNSLVTHCAEVSSSFGTRITHVEGEVDRLRRRDKEG